MDADYVDQLLHPRTIEHDYLDALLTEFARSLPADPELRWVLRCHPSVYQLIRYAFDAVPPMYPEPAPVTPEYGQTDIVVDVWLGEGQWEMRAASADMDAPIRSGRLLAIKREAFA